MIRTSIGFLFRKRMSLLNRIRTQHNKVERERRIIAITDARKELSLKGECLVYDTLIARWFRSKGFRVGRANLLIKSLHRVSAKPRSKENRK